MHNLKNDVQEEIGGKSTIDPTIDERYGDKVLFQHKIDRLNLLLKETKFNATASKTKGKV